MLAETGLDADALENYFRENLEYLSTARGIGGFEVDPDCVELGTLQPRRRPCSIDLVELVSRSGSEGHAIGFGACSSVTWTRASKPVEQYLRLAEREPFDYLFFSDVGGFRWYVDTYAKADAERAKPKPLPARAADDRLRTRGARPRILRA